MIEAFISKFNINKKIFLFMLDAVCAFIYLFIMAYSFSRPLRNMVNLLTGNSIIIITLYFFLFYAFYFIFSFPLKYYQGLGRIKTHNFIAWFQSVFQKEISVFFILFFVVQVIYFFLETDVLWWWLPVAFLCIVSRYAWELAPKYLAPLFFKATALDSSEFKKRLIELASRANIKVADVFFLSNAKSDIVIAGYRGVRKLMLSDKIMDYAPEEIEILVARETAYHYYKFVRSKLIIEALVMLLSFFIVNVAFKPTADYFGYEFIFDIETLPVLIGLFFIVFLVMSFIQNYFLRSMDKQADVYALNATQSPAAFISLLIRQQQNKDNYTLDYFANQILNGRISDVSRIAMAQDYAQGMCAKEKGR